MTNTPMTSREEFPYEVFDIDGDIHYIPKGENGKHMYHAICKCKPVMDTGDYNGFEVWHKPITKSVKVEILEQIIETLKSNDDCITSGERNGYLKATAVINGMLLTEKAKAK